MKPISTLSLLLLAGIFQSSFAQTNIHWSPEFRDALAFSDAIQFGDHFYAARTNYNGFVYSRKATTTFSRYDQHLNFINSRQARLTVEGAKASFDQFLVFQNDLQLLLRVAGKVSGSENFVICQIDTSSLLRNKASTTIFDDGAIRGHSNFQLAHVKSPDQSIFDANSPDTITLQFHDLPKNDYGSYLDERGRPLSKTVKKRDINESAFTNHVRLVLRWEPNIIVMISEKTTSSIDPMNLRGRSGRETVGLQASNILGDIEIRAFTLSGEILWKRTITNQRNLYSSSAVYYNSFLLSNHLDELRLFLQNTYYQDQPSGILMIKITKEGRATLKGIATEADDKLQFLPFGSHQILENEYFITSKKRGKYRYGILRVN
ncbi:MAG: hypothetical protein AAFZ63_25120 [Bacteroidota bacterium]